MENNTATISNEIEDASNEVVDVTIENKLDSPKSETCESDENSNEEDENKNNKQEYSENEFNPVVQSSPTNYDASQIENQYDIPKVPIRLFVGCIPRDYDEEKVRPIFEEFGTVLELSILRDRTTNQHKGSAFIKMSSIKEADAAIRNLSGQHVLDVAVGALQIRYATAEIEKLNIPAEAATPGVDAARLFIGSLSKQATEEDIKGFFSSICPIEEVYIIRDLATGQSKGCAFVKLATKEMALFAIKSLNGNNHLCGSRPLEVRFAETKKFFMAQTSYVPTTHPGHIAPNPINQMNNVNYAEVPIVPNPYTVPNSYIPPETVVTSTINISEDLNTNPRESGVWREYFAEDGRPYYHNTLTNITQWEKPQEFDTAGPPGANLFIFHVPSEWSLRELIYNFRPFGRITSASIATDKVTGRNRGYAFVSYTDIHSAIAAVNQMNGFATGTKRLKVAIKQNEEQHVLHLLNSSNSYANNANNMTSRHTLVNRYGGGQTKQNYVAPY